MKVNEDKLVDNFIAKVMKGVELETPSKDFTSNVMKLVYEVNKSDVTTYKPLVSKLGWSIIFGSVFVLVLALVFNNNTQHQNISELSLIKSVMDVIQIKMSPILSISKISLNAIFLLTFMLLIQISFLKNHFDKKYKL